MNVSTQPLAGYSAIERDDSNFERVFRQHYAPIARLLARIVHDRARAEELAADAFCRFHRRAPSSDRNPKGWLYKTAVRLGLDELRRLRRRSKYEPLLAILGGGGRVPSPEHLHAASQEQTQVRSVLAKLKQRDAELLILRSEGMSYQEVAGILDLNEASMGTLLRRAQESFRKEYVKRYGPRNL
jgi:RNA polymerase sigma-70 factor (ECF subfamily)